MVNLKCNRELPIGMQQIYRVTNKLKRAGQYNIQTQTNVQILIYEFSIQQMN
ncbi:unnamed protein product [Paramecium sonneborni]|uniref:Uncharacterized protein n=1 Tax=Paramecium sonneborni TaxID=65129 RepID=A0A8S1RKG5_9CILI|nr:unnamed protein product [Paramecium sonneborni]